MKTKEISKIKVAAGTFFFLSILFCSVLSARASSELVLENAKITKVSGETITAKLDGKKYSIDVSDANFFRNDGKKAEIGEMFKGDHIDVRGEKESAKKISADSITNTSIWDLEDSITGKIKKIDKKKKRLTISTSDQGSVKVYVADDTTIRAANGKAKDFMYFRKKYTVKAKGLFDGAGKVIYKADTVRVTST
jgi:hypothetical protein